MNSINDLKKIYESTEIPQELEFTIKKSIRTHKMKKNLKIITTAAATVAIIFTAAINLNSNIAMAMSDIPIVGSLVRVLTFKYDKIENENVHLNIESPIIEGLSNQHLTNSLNEKYLEESQKLYEEFISEMGEIVKLGGHLGIDSGYEIITDTEDILSIGRYTVNTVGSSSTTYKYDTIDKKNGVLITLPSLFKNDQYVDVISEYIIEDMKQQMAENQDLIYWIGDDTIEEFKSIKMDQSFYINGNGKLVISFDKYEVAPGYMGVLVFEIPSEILKDILVSNAYIK